MNSNLVIKEVDEMKKQTAADTMCYYRYFERVSTCPDAKLPERATSKAAGYDFYSNEDVVIPPHEIRIVFTGIKAAMLEDEVLLLFNRSSNPLKKGLILANGVGVVDADYFNNPDNEGNIGFMFYNNTGEPYHIKKGNKLGQGVFTEFLLVENDSFQMKENVTRLGGFGSTGE